jgi:hypothetical protein
LDRKQDPICGIWEKGHDDVHLHPPLHPLRARHPDHHRLRAVQHELVIDQANLKGLDMFTFTLRYVRYALATLTTVTFAMN